MPSSPRRTVPATPSAAAERADLTYVSDAEPGIRRKRAGRGFGYPGLDGMPVRDEDTLERIRALAIPPAWRDVWISPDPAGHVQATGRDEKGRKQYRYHPGWTACRDESKFSSLVEFGHLLPRLRATVEADLRKRSLSRERVLALVVWLLDKTLIRIGNDVYAKENKSFGLTTLKARHVEVDGGTLRFSFVGKSGQEWKLKLGDRRIASVVSRMQELPGQRLFQYIGEEGTRRSVHSQDVNAYIQAAIGPDFTSKHFRTWGATILAALLLADTGLPGTGRERTRTLNALIDKVATRLRNTRAVCRRCYIHPQVLDAWEAGMLGPELGEMRKRYRLNLKGLDRDESLILRWLEAIDEGSGR